MRIGVGAGLDVVLVLVFVAIGRRSHEEGLSLAGLAETAWPFLVGLAVGWAIMRAWREPEALPIGAGIWVTTVVCGMLLRTVSGQGTALAFMIVATLFLGAVLLGWRLIARFAPIPRART
ncbi:DUF3054 domain-containing protein [Actinomadura sp. 9N407]|uniref:DUF3054 domain-containing protein n=1 Tax=Actinomadura sp. 9N407 TaxID=3375154 RepID=UPI0037B5068B